MRGVGGGRVGEGVVRVRIHFSVSDSCSILSSSSSSRLFLTSSSSRALADSSMASRISASGLEAELVGLDVSP